MADDIFIVIATFGVVFVITAAMLQGLITTVDLLRAGFKGRRQSQVMVLLARFIVVPLVLVGLAAIVQLGPTGSGPQVDMAVCVIVLTAGPPFIPAIAKLAHGDLPYATSSALMLTVLTWILLPFTLPAALNFLGTGAAVSSSLVAEPLIAFYAIPLVAGLLIRARYPNLAMEIIPHLKTIAIAALLLSVTLYIAASWNEFTSLFVAGVLGFALAIPLISLLIGFVLSPPYARRTTCRDPTPKLQDHLDHFDFTAKYRRLPRVCVLRPRIVSVGRSCDLDLCARFDLRNSARHGRIGQAT